MADLHVRKDGPHPRPSTTHIFIYSMSQVVGNHICCGQFKDVECYGEIPSERGARTESRIHVHLLCKCCVAAFGRTVQHLNNLQDTRELIGVWLLGGGSKPGRRQLVWAWGPDLGTPRTRARTLITNHMETSQLIEEQTKQVRQCFENHYTT